jgi:hypothetical protein
MPGTIRTLMNPGPAISVEEIKSFSDRAATNSSAIWRGGFPSGFDAVKAKLHAKSPWLGSRGSRISISGKFAPSAAKERAAD